MTEHAPYIDPADVAALIEITLPHDADPGDLSGFEALMATVDAFNAAQAGNMPPIRVKGLIDAHLDAATALIDWLDALEGDSDLEPGADAEPEVDEPSECAPVWRGRP